MNGRGRFALVALAVLAVYLFAYAVKVSEENRVLLGRLETTNRGIVDKLADVFTRTLAAEEAARTAGTVPQATVDRIVEGLKGYVDPVLIEEALSRARVTARGERGPAGPPGPPGPAAAATTTSTATTTTTRPPATTSSTTTTTTRPGRATTTTRCSVGALGLCVLR